MTPECEQICHDVCDLSQDEKEIVISVIEQELEEIEINK
jgi:hypothetical protein